MGTDVKLSSEFTIIYGGEVIAYCTDFTLEKNKEIIDITKLGDTWKNKKVDMKDFSVSFNGMVTRGDTVTALLWNPLTGYTVGQYVVLAGKAWEAQGSTTGDNPTTDDGTNWLETSEWLIGTTYAADDLVYYLDVANEARIYKSLQGSNIGNDPTTEAAYWERLETNYESLLNELKNNDTIVTCTIKPSSVNETYYYGEGVLSSLSASFGVGDKATFSGAFDGSGALYSGLGPELAGAWNTAAFWDTVQSGWTINEGVDIDCDGTAAAELRKSFCWDIGDSFRVEMSLTRTGGQVFAPYDGSTPTVDGWINASGTYIDADYGPVGNTNMYVVSGTGGDGFAGTITNISIRKIL